jgi:uncharacterized protein (TIGR02145 family)
VFTVTVKFCGTDGIPESFTATSGNTYLTHQYPTGTGGAMQCWMVSNSKEGSPQAYCYNNDCGTYPSIGYYYNRAQGHSNASCPSGWHIPADSEARALIPFLKTSDAILPYDLRKWWYGPTASVANGALGGIRGCGGGYGGIGEMAYYYYGASGSKTYFIASSSDIYENFDGCSSSTDELNIVRCVKN